MGGVHFLDPRGLALLAGLVPLVVLYVLKIRRTRQRVPSTWLWAAAQRDLVAKHPFRKLVPELPLLLEILTIAALALALARPTTRGGAIEGDHVAVVVDASASMATRVGGAAGTTTRIEQAKAAARNLVSQLGPDADAVVIEAGREARVVSPLERDPRKLQAAIDSIGAREVEGDLAAAVALAADRLRSLGGHARIVVVTDGALAHADPIVVAGVPTDVLGVGDEEDNAAIVRVDVRSGRGRDLAPRASPGLRHGPELRSAPARGVRDADAGGARRAGGLAPPASSRLARGDARRAHVRAAPRGPRPGPRRPAHAGRRRAGGRRRLRARAGFAPHARRRRHGCALLVDHARHRGRPRRRPAEAHGGAARDGQRGPRRPGRRGGQLPAGDAGAGRAGGRSRAGDLLRRAGRASRGGSATGDVVGDGGPAPAVSHAGRRPRRALGDARGTRLRREPRALVLGDARGGRLGARADGHGRGVRAGRERLAAQGVVRALRAQRPGTGAAAPRAGGGGARAHGGAGTGLGARGDDEGDGRRTGDARAGAAREGRRRGAPVAGPRGPLPRAVDGAARRVGPGRRQPDERARERRPAAPRDDRRRTGDAGRTGGARARRARRVGLVAGVRRARSPSPSTSGGRRASRGRGPPRRSDDPDAGPPLDARGRGAARRGDRGAGGPAPATAPSRRGRGRRGAPRGGPDARAGARDRGPRARDVRAVPPPDGPRLRGDGRALRRPPVVAPAGPDRTRPPAGPRVPLRARVADPPR